MKIDSGIMKNRQKQKKVLFTSHTANFSKFNRPFMRWFHEQGWEVHYASAGEEDVKDCDRHFMIPFNRSPWSLKNITAYRQLKAIINREDYDMVHTHTPMGGVVTRLAARQARKRGTKVIYTAHGFHFFTGAPLINWAIYYPVEKLLAHDVDVLITINAEDYTRAISHFKAPRIEKIDGVGVDLSRFAPATSQQRKDIREKLGYGHEDKILLSVAEFTTNKNQACLISANKKLQKDMPNLRLLLAGTGYRFEACKEQVKGLGLDNNVNMLGYVNNIDDIYAAADILVSSSAREGLPVSIIEGMARGLPIVCTDIRGHVDLVTNERNGLLFPANDMTEYIAAVESLLSDKKTREKMSKSNTMDVQKYSLDQAIESMANIYRDLM